MISVQSSGIDRGDGAVVLSVLSLEFQPGDQGAGRVIVHLAGDGAIALMVEVLDVALRDVTRPYRAPSGKVPDHGI